MVREKVLGSLAYSTFIVVTLFSDSLMQHQQNSVGLSIKPLVSSSAKQFEVSAFQLPEDDRCLAAKHLAQIHLI